jgi:single-stranded DNA-binding protein
MKGIEAAFVGKIASEPESKVSAAGNSYLRLNVQIGEGSSDTQYCNVSCFKDEAAKLSGNVAKGSSVYCEGRIRLDKWTSKTGEAKAALSMAAWRIDVLGQIGRKSDHARCPKPEPEHIVNAISGTDRLPAFLGPPAQEPRKIVGRDDFDSRMDNIPYLDS